MKINIALLGSPLLITVEVPDGVNFTGYAKNIKADGGLFADQLHIPYDKIIAMAVEGSITFIPTPTAPTTETKQ